jgi:hypothetical protein
MILYPINCFILFCFILFYFILLGTPSDYINQSPINLRDAIEILELNTPKNIEDSKIRLINLCKSTCAMCQAKIVLKIPNNSNVINSSLLIFL